MDLNKVKQRLEQTRGGLFKAKRNETYQHYEAEGILPKIKEVAKASAEVAKPYLTTDSIIESYPEFNDSLHKRYGGGGDPFTPTITHILLGITSREDVIKERKLSIINNIEKMRDGYPDSPVKIRKKNYETDRKIKAAINAAGKDLLREYLCDDCDDCW